MGRVVNVPVVIAGVALPNAPLPNAAATARPSTTPGSAKGVRRFDTTTRSSRTAVCGGGTCRPRLVHTRTDARPERPAIAPSCATQPSAHTPSWSPPPLPVSHVHDTRAAHATTIPCPWCGAVADEGPLGRRPPVCPGHRAAAVYSAYRRIRAGAAAARRSRDQGATERSDTQLPWKPNGIRCGSIT